MPVYEDVELVTELGRSNGDGTSMRLTFHKGDSDIYSSKCVHEWSRKIRL
jgi:hypothetical protein